MSRLRKRVRRARNPYRFRRKIRIGLNETAYSLLLNLSLESQRNREDIIRAAIRDYIANDEPYEDCIINQKRPRVAHVKLSDAAADHFADLAFIHDNCHGYGRYLGSIVEKYFDRFKYADLVRVFSAYADILIPILQETS